MLHLDLFSGIGGFAYAADQVWNDIEHVFCEIDPFCQAILKKHWPTSKIYGDIRTLTHSRSPEPRGLPGDEREALSAFRCCDLLTGGFPCQPFSVAGQRKGTSDDRYLWPAMFAIIKYTLPKWVIAENVRGLVTWSNGLVLETCCADLESIGYEVQPIIIPACAVGAPHRRDRVWIVAHAKSQQAHASKSSGLYTKSGLQNPNITNTECAGLERRKSADGTRYGGQRDRDRGEKGGDWSENWPEVATRLCRLDDGLPNGLARPRGWRNAALKAYGNAIVPQVAINIMRAINESILD